MIRDINKTFLQRCFDKPSMSASDLLCFRENFDTMTVSECLAFIERSLRQIDRLDHLPGSTVGVDREELASIRQALNELETLVRSYPAND